MRSYRLCTIISGILMTNILNANVFVTRPEVIKFIDEIVVQHELDKDKITSAFGQISSSSDVIRLMTKQYEALPWHKYRAVLINNKKVQGGVEFWKEHRALLTKAEKEYGIPAQFIVAIIGIESMYGKSCGKYPVMQALATLAFDYQPRAEFFKNELKEYLLLVTEQDIDPLLLKGSYAGAIGMPQFIASSYRKFAVDFDNSGQINLSTSIPQVIGSVANYFKEHGWQTGEPVLTKAITNSTKHKNLPIAARNSPLPAISLNTIHEHDVKPATHIENLSTDVAWLEFDNADGKEYWLGLYNFYVITRYNNSTNYARAVYELGNAIAKKYSTP